MALEMGETVAGRGFCSDDILKQILVAAPPGFARGGKWVGGEEMHAPGNALGDRRHGEPSGGRQSAWALGVIG